MGRREKLLPFSFSRTLTLRSRLTGGDLV